MKKLFNFLFVFFLVILVSCSNNSFDCSSYDTNYEKYTYDMESEKCILTEKIRENICGNSILEEDETYCNCPTDVLKEHPNLGCFGSEGEFLENICSDKLECVLSENEKVSQETKEVVFKNSEINIKADMTIKKPFIINAVEDNKINFEFELFEVQTNRVAISNIILKEIVIKDSKGVVIASKDIDKNLAKIDDKINEDLEVNNMGEYSNNLNMKAELIVDYRKVSLNSQGEEIKSENKREILKYSLGYYIILDANFLE